MIVLEGPDGGGKTTLAKKLADLCGFEYRRPPKEALSSTDGPGVGLAEWWDEQLKLPRDRHQKAIYDRCTFVSDVIYSMVQERPTILCLKTFESMVDRARGMIDLFIFCLPTLDRLLSSFNQHEQLKGLTKEKLARVREQYAFWAETWDCLLGKSTKRCMVYDWDNEQDVLIKVAQVRRFLK